MLKLLLKEEKREIKIEYGIRFLTILFFGISFVLILFLISLIPSFFVLKIDKDVLVQELSVAQNSELNEDKKRLREKLQSLQSTLNIVDEPTTEISYYIQQITDRQPRNVSISSIGFSKENSKKVILLQGNANSRESLASFTDSLEMVSEFESVNLPFSSFARGADIPFSITINLVDKNEK